MDFGLVCFRLFACIFGAQVEIFGMFVELAELHGEVYQKKQSLQSIGFHQSNLSFDFRLTFNFCVSINVF